MVEFGTYRKKERPITGIRLTNENITEVGLSSDWAKFYIYDVILPGHKSFERFKEKYGNEAFLIVYSKKEFLPAVVGDWLLLEDGEITVVTHEWFKFFYEAAADEGA